ncbi:hypothetical protein LUZ61_017010 [Rhynchospora tenuis]|uniref:KIB1-4 beta-propeller domain-containing protein n=1 Tax=Rhynchospora tenuis TaxID=198213 RepID=A0AAD5Z6M1_9POAL|nr:hypothetical protein LUZ61_017010 [Rhynchospora tenuis]
MGKKNPASEFRDWANLLPEIVGFISEKVKSITDYVRFRAVCSHWRSACLPKPRHLPPQLPWLMFPWDTRDKDDVGIHLFYDLWESKMHELHLPVTIDMTCCGSCGGWLLLVATGDKEIFLLNPLSQVRVDLPPFTAWAKHLGDDWDAPRWDVSLKFCFASYCDSKMILSTDLTDPECLIILFNLNWQTIFFCRVGDPCWTSVNIPEENRLEDVTYYNGRLYLNYDPFYVGSMTIIDLTKPEDRIVYHFEPELKTEDVRIYFLEGKSGVYIVAVFFRDEDHTCYRMKKIELFQFDEQSLKLQQITDSSNTVIFKSDHVNCLAVCSDEWDSLDGGSMYAPQKCAQPGGNGKLKKYYNICFSKLDDFKLEPLVHGLREQPLLEWTPPTRWFQPSFG